MDTDTALRELRRRIHEDEDILQRTRTVSDEEPEEIIDLKHVPLDRAVYSDNMRLNRLYAKSQYKNGKLESEIDEVERRYDQIRAELNNCQIDLDDAKAENVRTRANITWYKRRLLVSTAVAMLSTLRMCI